jgi:GNAT superfamily N-acetyltransferase
MSSHKDAMGLTYFKRYRFEIFLGDELFASPTLPPGYSMVAWRPTLLDVHAETKYRSFCLEIDANVFPCLGDQDGCRRLMSEITRRDNFVQEATWLLTFQPPGQSTPEYCGTIQGLRDNQGYGAVQNLGVTPMHRSRGLGTALLRQSLDGFRSIGLRRAYLEVTAQNTGAIRLYLGLGFRRVKTVYKAVEVAYA